ncbi:MAG: universal stress protein [Alphaproteobacteria bacterium]|nr:hypothetical protein [Hyphomonas sp.]MBR9806864.1 universal stress protein [Alphaproteobacteria bacterium]|tara:strand:- start:3010 stop:3843 length:834 start_codon:yes stop_codon:yes gene_type:complete
MSVVAMLQGTSKEDRSTTLSALALARKMNVPVRGLCALPDPNAAMMVIATPEATGLAGTTTQSIIEMQDEVLKVARASFEDICGSGAHGLSCEFIHDVNTVEQSGSNAATLAEAVIFPRTAAKGGEPLNLAFEHVLMTAGLPVVLGGTYEPFNGPAIIAWDGSNGAARAVRFHLPILRAMGDVIIAQNKKDMKRDPDREVAAPHALQDWLKFHDITSKTEEIEGEVATGLLAMAKGANASMIVAGAYGHSRLTERLFGGTTRRLLTAEEAPALALAH